MKKTFGAGPVLTTAPDPKKVSGKKGAVIRAAPCAAGSGGSLVAAAVRAGAELLLTGELKHHEILDAAEAGIPVALLGHAASERPAMRRLADRLADALPDVTVRFAENDRDVLRVG